FYLCPLQPLLFFLFFFGSNVQHKKHKRLMDNCSEAHSSSELSETVRGKTQTVRWVGNPYGSHWHKTPKTGGINEESAETLANRPRPASGIREGLTVRQSCSGLNGTDPAPQWEWATF